MPILAAEMVRTLETRPPTSLNITMPAFPVSENLASETTFPVYFPIFHGTRLGKYNIPWRNNIKNLSINLSNIVWGFSHPTDNRMWSSTPTLVQESGLFTVNRCRW